mgnify:FL=1
MSGVTTNIPSSVDNELYNRINIMFISYSINAMVIFIKYFFSSAMGRNPNNRPAEDKMEKVDENDELIKRKWRITANDVENIPIDMSVFFIAFLITCFAVLSKQGENEAFGLTVLICIYTFARIMFMIFYLTKAQPWRTIAFIIGKISTLCALGIMVSSAFKVNFALFAK